MTIFKYVLVAALAIGFTGCVDIDEKIDLKKDGSGIMTFDMDMSQALAMMQDRIGKEELEKRGFSKMDTTINMKDVLAQDTSLQADKRKALSTGSVQLTINMDQKILTIHLTFPFSSLANLQTLYAALSDGSLHTAQLFKNLGGGAGNGGSGGMRGANPDVDQFNAVYDFTSSDGLIGKRVDTARWKALLNVPKIDELKQLAQANSGMEIDYTTTIVLPRPVKKIDNSLAILSEDKKTVILKFNLLEVLFHPEKFEYSIEY
jgi:hypothetical protein